MAGLQTDVNIEFKNEIVELAEEYDPDINIFKCHDRIVINTSPSGIVTSPLTLGKLTMPSANASGIVSLPRVKGEVTMPSGSVLIPIFYHEIGDLGALSQSGGLNLVMWLVIVT